MHRLSPIAFCLVFVLVACSSAPRAAPAVPAAADPTAADPTPADPTPAAPSEASSIDPIRAALDAPERPEAERGDDATRKPHAVLSFFGIRPGMQVADLMCGRGWYTEILARAVGPTGKVYCQNNAFVVERFADVPLRERLARPDLGNVVRLDRELDDLGLPAGEVDDLGLPAGELDVALMVLFYHDTIWQKVDRAKMNAAVFAALAPGGVFGIIDHHAAVGSGDRDVKTLHRIDAELVKRELLAAGFVLAAESDVLHHPEDDRTRNVFDPAIRRNTDRFVYRFRKPTAPGE